MGLSTKIIIAVIAIALIGGAASFLYYQITGLTHELAVQKQVNADLIAKYSELKDHTDNLIKDVDDLNKKSKSVRDSLGKHEQAIQNMTARNAQIKMRNDDVDNFLAMQRAQQECIRLNFLKAGQCVNGTFLPEGGTTK